MWNPKVNIKIYFFHISLGPHLHFELREEGRPITLDNVVISGYLIIAGTYRRDEYCSDPIGCQFARNDGKYCATRFKQIEDGTISCPSVRGNHGKCFVYRKGLGMAHDFDWTYKNYFVHLFIIYIFIGGGFSYGKDPGWKLPAYPFLKANSTNLGMEKLAE